VIDPLSDPRAHDLLTAVPGEVGTLAGDFHAAAQESQMTSAGLSAAQHDGSWTGHAADAFRKAIGRLPRELDRVQDGFRAVAAALDSYESELTPVQTQFVDAAYQLGQARAELGPVEADQQAAMRAWQALLRSGTALTAARLQAEEAVAGADGAVRRQNAEVDRLSRRASELLDEFQAIRDSCRAAIATAQQGTIIRSADGHTPVVYRTGPVSGLDAQLR
jgi:hypothetical protein